METNTPIRLQRYMAQAGVASRRKCELLINQGRVTINGQTAVIGQSVIPSQDRVELDGRLLTPTPPYYLILHKPEGYITTVSDPAGRPTVMDLIPPIKPRIYPVGRLDKDTTGLLLLTNDGELTHGLLHPSSGVQKVYIAKLNKDISFKQLTALEKGVILEDGPTAPCRARKIDSATVELTIKEGRKRQVRRMFAALGHQVIALKRVRFGPLQLGDLLPGAHRPLNKNELKALRKLIPCKASRRS